MINEEWIKKQFEYFKKYKHRYREVLIITSFIETIIKEEAYNGSAVGRKREFKNALELLGLKINSKNEKISNCKQNSQYKKDCLEEINLLRVQRNELLHDIIKKRLPKEYIDGIIKEMAKNIKEICARSNLIRGYFKKNYKTEI